MPLPPMLKKEQVQKFTESIKSEGFDKACTHYAPIETGDKLFDKLHDDLMAARTNIQQYIGALVYNYEIETD